MRTVVYRNKWPWGEDIIHVAEDGKSFVGVSKQDGYDFGFIHDLCVHDSERRKGRGNWFLILAELVILQIYNCHYSVLRVVPGTWMEEWYRRKGYETHETDFEMDGYIELIKKL